MLIRHDLDHGWRLVTVFCSGNGVSRECGRHLSNLIARPELPSAYACLVDAREADVSWSTEDARQLAPVAVAVGRALKVPRVAVLVSSSVAFGTARMFQTMAELHGAAPGSIHVTMDPEEARRFVLGSTPQHGP